MSLTTDQVKMIKDYVMESRVSIPSLRDDLVDHLCCEIEGEMSEGKTFDEAVAKVLPQNSPKDLYKIEQDTKFLLHPNKVIMKKLMYFFGLGGTICMSMGLTLKILHMPGGEELVNCGFLVFAGLFLPMIIAQKFNSRSQLTSVEKLKLAFGIVSAIGFAQTLIMKLTGEISLATIIFFCTAAVFSFGFLPLHFYQMYRNSLKETN
jgi:hypothetical protein